MAPKKGRKQLTAAEEFDAVVPLKPLEKLHADSLPPNRRRQFFHYCIGTKLNFPTHQSPGNHPSSPNVRHIANKQRP